MLGRAVVVLCSLAGTAVACPVRQEYSDESQGVAAALVVCGLIAIAFLWSRANDARRSFMSGRRPDILDLEVLRRIAHMQRVRTAWLLLLGLPTTLAATTFYMAPAAVFVVVPLMAVALSICVARLCRLDRLATLPDHDSLRVVSDGHFLFAARGHQLIGWVSASPAMIARASALPVARLRR